MGLEHVFRGAHPHVAQWPDQFWHSGIGEPHSSQALCVSLWGTLASDRRRTSIVDAMFSLAELGVGKPTAPEITCEAGADGNLAALLNETGGEAKATCVDALVRWRQGVVCVESKFTEPGFGACSQTRPRIDRPPGARPWTEIELPPACSGHYGPGSDRKTFSHAPCRLQVWDGNRAPRLYWQIAWDIFRPEVLKPDGRPCPFSGPSFQLMRNLALARAAAAPRSQRPRREQPPETVQREWGLLVVHVAGHKHAQAHRDELENFRDLLLDDVRDRVGLISYEQTVPLLRDHGLESLAIEVERRLAAVAEGSGSSAARAVPPPP